jgi:hypothetical protein
LRRISYNLTADLIIHNYIMSNFDYCCTVWSKGNLRYLNKIDKIQIRAARIILNKTLQIRNQDILKDFGWMSFNERCNFHTGILIYKACNNLTPSYISGMQYNSQFRINIT